MDITIEPRPPERVETEALIVPIFEGQEELRFAAADLFQSGEIAGKPLELTLLHHPPGVAARRVLLAGGGPPEKYNPDLARKLAGAAVRLLKGKSVKKIAFALNPGHSSAEYARAVVEGAVLANFDPDRYRTGDGKKAVDTLAVIPASGAERIE